MLLNMKQSRYEPGQIIVKRGDHPDKLYFIKQGTVNVEIPLQGDSIILDSLHGGSAFCAYSPFNEELR